MQLITVKNAHHNCRHRDGISLLEVLFSIFVLSVGLLGLAAMVPVGQHQVTEASHADRSTAIGIAAHKEIKIRDLMDEASWVQYDFGTSTYVSFTPPPANPTFVIDPLSVVGNVASGSPDSQYNVFPYGTVDFGISAPTLPKLQRISIADISTGTASGLPMVDRIFRCLDDRTFELPSDETMRPKHIIDSVSGLPLPTQAQSEGNYSWLIMVSPPAFAGGPSTISVVVFYKRDLVVDTSSPATSPPSERFVYLDLVNGGLGGAFGGDAQLRETSSATPEAAEGILKVRPNQWILVTGQLDSATAGSTLPVHKWYRVVSTSEMQSGSSPWIVDVTLSGPDWNGTYFRDVDGTGGKTMFATICDGVVGVFEKTVQLDEPSLWTSH